MSSSLIHIGVAVSDSTGTGPAIRHRLKRRIYPALRLDFGISHAVAALARMGACGPARWQSRVESEWGGGEAIAFLSVRSAFAAMLEALAWPEKSEVLITGINIADMAGIVGSLGHVPVPIDLDPETLAPDPAEIVSKIGPATRAIVVAQLFGGRIEMGPLVAVARRHGLLTIDDSAQAYATRSNRGLRECDVRLFSFGLLKSGTALGGAIAEVGDTVLRMRMRTIQAAWRRQTKLNHAVKIAKALMLLLLQRPAVYGLFSRLCAVAGTSSSVVLRRVTRGFGGSGTEALLGRLRRQPCAPLLALLTWRLATEDGRRIARRAAAGSRMMAGLADLDSYGLTCLGQKQERHTRWLTPVSVPDPEELRHALVEAGFDASGASNVIAIGGKRVTSMVEGLVFLPCYPEMSEAARARVCTVARNHALGRHKR